MDRETESRTYELEREHTVERLKRGVLSYIGVEYGKSDDELEYPRQFLTSAEKYPQRAFKHEETVEVARMLFDELWGNDDRWDSLSHYEVKTLIQDEIIGEYPGGRSDAFDSKYTYAAMLAVLEREYGDQNGIGDLV